VFVVPSSGGAFPPEGVTTNTVYFDEMVRKLLIEKAGRLCTGNKVSVHSANGRLTCRNEKAAR
jgi:hypothetical protein